MAPINTSLYTIEADGVIWSKWIAKNAGRSIQLKSKYAHHIQARYIHEFKLHEHEV